MKRRSLTRAFSAAVATVLISSGLLVGAAATVQAESEPPRERDLLECVLTLELANCLTGDSDLLGTGLVGQPLELVQPVFGFLPANLLGLVETDITWLCNGVEIPGTAGFTEVVPTEALEGCQVAVQTVTTLLGFEPLTLVTDLIGITGDGEEPELPGSLLAVLISPPTLTGSGDIGDPLTLTQPVFDLVPALLGLLGTDITWLCDGVEIPGTKGLTQFTPTDLQAGCEIAVRTVSTLLSLLPLELLTNVIPVDEEEDPTDEELVPSATPVISGTKRVGGILRIHPGTWLGGSELVEPLFSYQWYNTEGAIPGATDREYAPRLSDAGRYLAATVTAKLTGFIDGLAITNVVKVAKVGSSTKLRRAGARLLSLRVTPAAANPTGKVKLMKGAQLLRTIRLEAADNGRRTVRLAQLAKGTHKIRAVYRGNRSLKRSTSQVLRLTLR